jgi:hypothetical protein
MEAALSAPAESGEWVGLDGVSVHVICIHICCASVPHDADFGLSRMMASVVLKTGRPAAGTLPYMAPECFNKGGVGSNCKTE